MRVMNSADYCSEHFFLKIHICKNSEFVVVCRHRRQPESLLYARGGVAAADALGRLT